MNLITLKYILGSTYLKDLFHFHAHLLRSLVTY